MSRFVAVVAVAMLASLLFGAPAPRSGRAEGLQAGLGDQLRFIGRDPLTGQPAGVDDRFIAEVEEAIERYGKDEREPVAPPQVQGEDVAALSVPRLGISAAPMQRFGLDAFGRLEVPQDTAHVGWNPAYSTVPGAGGATFFAAHFEYGGRPGIFFRLSTLQPGDAVMVMLAGGTEVRYRVTSTVDYQLAAIDMGAVLQGREGRESITLMTCSGPPTVDGYPLRTVVLAERES